MHDFKYIFFFAKLKNNLIFIENIKYDNIFFVIWINFEKLETLFFQYYKKKIRR